MKGVSNWLLLQLILTPAAATQPLQKLPTSSGQVDQEEDPHTWQLKQHVIICFAHLMRPAALPPACWSAAPGHHSAAGEPHPLGCVASAVCCCCCACGMHVTVHGQGCALEQLIFPRW
jgi:hypothetical protein